MLSQLFLFLGCGGSNTGTTGAAGTTGSGAAGTTGSGAAGTTGSGAAGTTGSTGTAGTTGSTGTAGTTGSTGTAGTTGTGGTPVCVSTVTKGGACATTDQQLCTKTCGPEKTGTKTETCTAGAYVEGSVCSFPAVSTVTSDGTYMCYAVPATASSMCPTTAPMASSACAIPDCVVCGGTSAGTTTGYLDSTGAAKVGYCVCQAAATTVVWSCASATAWPCPGNTGC